MDIYVEAGANSDEDLLGILSWKVTLFTERLMNLEISFAYPKSVS